MKILHIGDLHYRKKNRYEQAKIIDALISAIEKNADIDICFFSGDLINNGTNKLDFQEADNFLFVPIIEKSKIQRDNLFICSGNHDVDRSVIVNSIISNFSSKKNLDRKSLELFYTKQSADKKASLQSNQNFFEYLQDSFQYKSEDIVDNLYTVHKREVEGIKIGIVTINSSWFCSGERDDKGELIIMPSHLEEAVNKIDECELKILMMHHPLNYFKQGILYEIEDLVHSNFNLLLVGHVHKEFIETQFRCNNGIYCNTSKASLCDEGDGAEIGFSIINIDVNDISSFRIERFHYIKPENKFIQLEPVIVTIPLGEEKHRQNAIRKKIISKYIFELGESNKLLLNYDEKNERAFLDTFTEPILSKDSDEETNISDKVNRLLYDDLVSSKDNILIFGKDKCGKTSLLKKIKLDLLLKYTNKGLIPIYIDYKHIESSENGFNIVKIVSNYYNISRADSQELINSDRLLMLIDNLNTTSSLHNEVLVFLREYQNIRFIVCSEYLTSRVFGEELDSLLYKKYFFKNLTRTELRLYTKKNPSIKEEDHEVVMEKVAIFCKQLHLPLSYWTISLILLIYKKSNDDYTKNLFSVLDSCVDEILIKKRFLFEKTNLKFEQYKILCSELAASLFEDYGEFEYSCSYSQMLEIVEKYINSNKRIILSPKDIVDFLHECGILKQKTNGSYTFRLNGLFEYFLAYHLKESPKFKNDIIGNPSTYLAFKNEIEIYTGFNRSDSVFLEQIFNKTKEALKSFKNKYSEAIDDTLMNKIKDAHQFEKSLKELLLKSPLSDTNKDLILDKTDSLDIDSDVHVKPIIENDTLNVEIIERYITILARVLKNSDGITNSPLINEIFNYLLETYCQFGFYMIDDFERTAKDENIKVREDYEVDNNLILGEEILNLLSRILPVLVQAMMYDGLGQLNFSKIIEEKIRELRVDVKNNQFKLFILYFLLMDIDLKGNKNIIDDVFEEIILPPLKVATFFKLNFYHAFKAFQNKDLENYLKNKIQKAQLRIDEKSDMDKIQRGLEKASKRKLIRKAKKR